MRRTRYIALAIIALLSVSCSKGDRYYGDILGGRSSFYDRNGRMYMMNIADNLVTDILDELELALDISRRGATSSSHFVLDGSLYTAGTTWSVKAEDDMLMGMTLHCSANDCWTMVYDGKYTFGDNNCYPTSVTLTARLLDNTADPSLTDESKGWRVSFEGERQERGGYGCSFGTPSGGEQQSIDYVNTRGDGAEGWDQIFGSIFLTVFKADQVVDAWCITFDGSPSQADYIRGL